MIFEGACEQFFGQASSHQRRVCEWGRHCDQEEQRGQPSVDWSATGWAQRFEKGGEWKK